MPSPRRAQSTAGRCCSPRRTPTPAATTTTPPTSPIATASRSNSSPTKPLAQVFWHLEGVADRPPDGLDVYPVRQSALDRAPAELVEHEVPGHALRIDVAELGVHPVPEFRQPHAAQGTAALDQTCAADNQRSTAEPGRATRIPFVRCVVIKSDVSLLNRWEVV